MQDVSAFSFLKGIVFANIASYIVLVPIHYYYNRPLQSISEITKNTEWAIQPPATVLYQDADQHHLWKIRSDGTDNQLLVPYSMKQYLVSADLTQILFFDDGKKLFHYDTNTEVLTTLWESDSGSSSNVGRLESVMQIDISPGGTKVAWVVLTKEDTRSPWATDFWKLYVHDFDTGQMLNYNYKANGSKIAWSGHENVLYVNCPPIKEGQSYGEISGPGKFLISESGIIQVGFQGAYKQSEPDIADNYGRLGSFSYSGGKIFVERRSDEEGSMKAWASTWDKGIIITKDEQVLFSFSDIPFFVPFPRHTVSDPTFIQGGQECLFLARKSIYLIDISTKKVGELVRAETYIVVSDTFQKKQEFFDRPSINDFGP